MRRAAWLPDGGPAVAFEGEGGPFFLGDLSDELGAVAETVRAPRQDGTATYHLALGARTINLTGSLLAYGSPARPALAELDRLRSWLAQAMAPNRWGRLIYYREDRAVQIRCHTAALPTFGTPVGTYVPFDVTFHADAPCWETAEETVLCVGAVQRFWHFPWGAARGPMGAFNRFATVDNPAAEPIYPTVEVFSTGQVITLTNRTTGQAVTIQHPIAAGQKLTVDLRDVSAFLSRLDAPDTPPEDVSHWMSLDSQPWGLRPGPNQIAVTNEVPEDTPLAYIRYHLPVMGV